MQIKFEDLEKGDEIIIPSNSNLKYLKLISKTKKGNWKCSMGIVNKTFTYIFNGINRSHSHTFHKNKHFQPDINQHNTHYYLNNKSNYVDMWLVKRE